MKEDRMKLLKYMLAGAVGFGIGGAIWGMSIPTTAKVPFTYTIGGIALGSIGGASLALFSKDIKKILKFALFDAIGGLFYGVALKKRILASSVAGMLGFGIGSLIGPIIGNLV